MAEEDKKYMDMLISKVSFIYSYISILTFVICLNIQWNDMEGRLHFGNFYFKYFVLLCVGLVSLPVSIYGQWRKKPLLMIPNLMMQLILTSLFLLQTLTMFIHAYKHKRCFDAFTFFTLIAILHGIFGYYLPYRHYCTLRKEQKRKNTEKQTEMKRKNTEKQTEMVPLNVVNDQSSQSSQ